MITTSKMKVIADPIHGPIPYTSIEHKILSSRIFNRLHNILQNSMAYYVYPSTKTSRFMHSLGVMHLSAEIYKNGCLNANRDILHEFLNKLNDELSKIIKENVRKKINEENISILMHRDVKMSFEEYIRNRLEFNPLSIIHEISGFLLNEKSLNHYLIPIETNSLKHVYYISLQAIRLLGLLHDVGHLPFSHNLEFMLESLWDDLYEKSKNNELKNLEKYIFNILKYYFNNESIKGLKIHEMISLDVMDYIFYDEIIKEKLIMSVTDSSRIDESLYREICLYAILCELTKTIFVDYEDFDALRALHDIVSSDLDADRLDFILRDGKNSGLLSSTGDIARILKFVKLVKYEDSFSFLPSIQTLKDIEQVLNDRFAIYKYLVCHHKVIRFDYLLEKAVKLLIEIEIEKSSENEKIEERINIGNDVLQLIDVLNKERKRDRRMYRFSQIDDFWLINVLRGKYFEILTKTPSSRTENEKTLLFFLEELFTGSRELVSSWKRDYQFFDFIDVLLENLKKKNILKTLDINLDINGSTTLQFLEKLDEMLVSKGWKHFVIKIENRLHEICSDRRILCADVTSKLKTGLRDLKLYAYDKERNEDTIMHISEVSNINKHLERSRIQSYRFLVYYPYSFKKEDIFSRISDCFSSILENKAERG